MSLIPRLIKSHTSKIIMYVYTFAPQQGVSGGDENASAYCLPATQQTHAQGVSGTKGAIPGQYYCNSAWVYERLCKVSFNTIMY